MIRCLAIVLALGATVASAEEQPGVSVQGYRRQDPACREWTNGCVVCRGDNGHAACSLPGIACEPESVICSDPKK